MAGMLADGVRTFEAGIKKWPSDAMHYQAYGVLLLRMAETGGASEAQAVSMLRKALDLNPSLAEAHYQLGQIDFAHGEIDKSIKHFLAALQNGDSSAKVHFALSRAYRRAGNEQEAAKHAALFQELTADRTAMKELLFLVGLSVFALGPPALFTDVTQQAGIHWMEFNGQSPERFLVESTTGGVAFLDFDCDGRLDLFLVNGGETPGGRSKTPVRNALYRNLGSGRFEEVAAKAGVDRLPFFGMGVAVADYDNDGHPDIYVTGYPSVPSITTTATAPFAM